MTFRLRPLASTDLDDILDVARDPEIIRWTTIPSPYGQGDGSAFIEESATLAENDVEHRFAVCTADEPRILGTIALRRHANRPHIGEIGYWTAPWARRRGVASGAVGLVVTFAWEGKSFARLEAYVDPRNVSSRGVMSRAGFALEGTVHGLQISRSGDLQDMLLFGLVKPAGGRETGPPVLDDPSQAVRGRFVNVPISSDEMRQRARDDERVAEKRRHR